MERIEQRYLSLEYSIFIICTSLHSIVIESRVKCSVLHQSVLKTAEKVFIQIGRRSPVDHWWQFSSRSWTVGAREESCVLTITFLINTLFTRPRLKEIKTFNDFFPHYKLLVQVLFTFPLKEVATFTYWLFLMSLTLFPFYTEGEGGQWTVADSD